MFKRFFKKKSQKKLLKQIKANLTEDFKIVLLKTNVSPELDSLIIDNTINSHVIVKAKIDKKNVVYLRFENAHGVFYEASTKNYQHIVDTIIFI